MLCRFFLSITLLCAFLPFFTGCADMAEENSDSVDLYYKPSESDKLSKEEVDSLIYHAKKFVARSKSLKLDEKARKIIRDRKPDCRFVYSGKKTGRVDFEWMIGDCKVLVLTARGKLTSENLIWYVQVKSIYISDPYINQ